MQKPTHCAWSVAVAMMLIPSCICFGQSTLGQTAISQPALPTDPVERSIELGKRYIYSMQNKDGHWETVPFAPLEFDKRRHYSPEGHNWGGRTALAVYALLASGERPREPRLKNAINLLKQHASTGTYAVGFRCLVWKYLKSDPETLRMANRDVQLLLRGVRADGLNS